MERALHDIAARYGMRARCFVVPTGLFVRVGGGPDERGGELDFAPVEGPDLRLDQVRSLQSLVRRMRGEAMPFADVRRELRAGREQPERFSPAATVPGYVLLTVRRGAAALTRSAGRAAGASRRAGGAESAGRRGGARRGHAP